MKKFNFQSISTVGFDAVVGFVLFRGLGFFVLLLFLLKILSSIHRKGQLTSLPPRPRSELILPRGGGRGERNTGVSVFYGRGGYSGQETHVASHGSQGEVSQVTVQEGSRVHSCPLAGVKMCSHAASETPNTQKHELLCSMWAQLSSPTSAPPRISTQCGQVPCACSLPFTVLIDWLSILWQQVDFSAQFTYCYITLAWLQTTSGSKPGW